MNSLILKRVLDEANYMLNTKETIREIATVFNVSNATPEIVVSLIALPSLPFFIS